MESLVWCRRMENSSRKWTNKNLMLVLSHQPILTCDWCKILTITGHHYLNKILSLKIKDLKEVILVAKSKLNSAEDGELECCVCLSRLVEGSDTRKLPCCHLFHRECVDKWLILCRSTCPLCRLSINCEAMRREMELTEELMIWFSSYYAPGF
ncbi:uncharacterized protein A4U43_C04F10710 [Asparagus officinalis]|uniref:RING-type E3 ubiquitin transferase n=1 Tax=Asparagus officinalis TaxID=4686 RepID=A0A5P1F1P8_ASPOF|nr:uncharacterized protein A4U43_C04F10710 [Asparagus officinalis]